MDNICDNFALGTQRDLYSQAAFPNGPQSGPSGAHLGPNFAQLGPNRGPHGMLLGFHLFALGVSVGGNANFSVRVGGNAKFSNAKLSLWGYRPTRQPNASVFATQCNIGFRQND